jgi:hypothetical protein
MRLIIAVVLGVIAVAVLAVAGVLLILVVPVAVFLINVAAGVCDEPKLASALDGIDARTRAVVKADLDAAGHTLSALRMPPEND